MHVILPALISDLFLKHLEFGRRNISTTLEDNYTFLTLIYLWVKWTHVESSILTDLGKQGHKYLYIKYLLLLIYLSFFLVYQLFFLQNFSLFVYSFLYLHQQLYHLFFHLFYPLIFLEIFLVVSSASHIYALLYHLCHHEPFCAIY